MVLKWHCKVPQHHGERSKGEGRADPETIRILIATVDCFDINIEYSLQVGALTGANALLEFR